jgi:sugar phosphate isomerase/epimerase
MTPLKIGACLMAKEIATHRDWLFGASRDVELQDFVSHVGLTSEFEDRIAAARSALDGHTGRLGIHGPYEGLDMDNKDPELRPLITARFLKALEAADRVGARQMVVHSPYGRWFLNNRLAKPNYEADVLGRVHTIMDPVVRDAEARGITLVVENIHDVDPAHRCAMVETFASDSVRLSVDTGHAHLARRMSGAPPVDFYIRDAGDLLSHVHLQDLDGHADRHWAPGEGEIHWPEVFRALAECRSDPHLVLELRHKADIPKGFAYLKSLGVVE